MQFKLTHLIFSNNNAVYGCFYQYNAYTRNITNDIAQFASESAAESNLEYRNLTFTNNLVALEHATDVQVGNLIDNGAYKSQDVTFNLPVSDIIDYTQVLTDINTNLTNLNTNIVNKNNQSDIVSCLNHIFCYQLQNGEYVSAFRDNNLNQINTDTPKYNMSFCNILFHVLTCLTSGNITKSNFAVDTPNRVLDNISKKLSVEVPNNASINYTDIRRLLIALVNCFINRPIDAISDPRIYSYFRAISDKLANANDLHTISQAIDLISTAIAQTNNTLTNTNTDLGNIATNINSIQSNPLIEVNIDVPYEVKNLTKKDTEY